MPRAFLFDMDGTIADTERETADALRHLHESLSCPPVTDADIDVFRTQGWNAFLRRLSLAPSHIGEVADVLRRRWAESIAQIPLFCGMEETLRALKKSGCLLGIVTSNTPENVHAFLRARDLEIFDLVAAGNAVLGKAAAIADVLQKLNVEARDAWYVGDEQRDIEAARAAGLRVISVTWGFSDPVSLRAMQPDECIDSPTELLRIAGHSM